MKELLFLLFLHLHATVLHFLRNKLIVYSGVNMAWLLVCSGNPSQTQSCWRTKPQYAVWPWPVNTTPPHPSSLDFLSSLDPSLPLSAAILLSSASSLWLCLHKRQSLPVLVLSFSSTPLHPLLLSSIFLSVQALLIMLRSTYINRRKEARKVVGSSGWMTLMRSLWLATQPKTNLPPSSSHLHPHSYWFP